MATSVKLDSSGKNSGAQGRARRGSNLGMTLIAFIVTILVIVGGAALILTLKPGNLFVAAAQPTATPTTSVQVAQPTDTPAPTATAKPTRTPRPTATRYVPSVTPSPTPVDLAKALPTLNKFLLEHSTSLDAAAADVTKSLAESDQISADAVGKATTQAQTIRKLRNEVMLLNISSAPLDIRQQIIFPAHVAYTDYANSVLQWMDLQIQAYRAYTAIVQASPTNLAKAKQQWTTQTALVAKQADLIRMKRAALDKALIPYNAYTAKVTLAAQLSGAASVFDSLDKEAIKLAGGKYKIVYRTALVNGEKPTLALVPRDGASPKIQLLGGSKVDVTGSQSMELAAGYYTIAAEALDWWVVAFDPQ